MTVNQSMVLLLCLFTHQGADIRPKNPKKTKTNHNRDFKNNYMAWPAFCFFFLSLVFYPISFFIAFSGAGLQGSVGSLIAGLVWVCLLPAGKSALFVHCTSSRKRERTKIKTRKRLKMNAFSISSRQINVRIFGIRCLYIAKRHTGKQISNTDRRKKTWRWFSVEDRSWKASSSLAKIEVGNQRKDRETETCVDE